MMVWENEKFKYRFLDVHILVISDFYDKFNKKSKEVVNDGYL